VFSSFFRTYFILKYVRKTKTKQKYVRKIKDMYKENKYEKQNKNKFANVTFIPP
jgi:hypothetical protein